LNLSTNFFSNKNGRFKIKMERGLSILQVDNTDKEDLKLMVRRPYAIKGFPYIEYMSDNAKTDANGV